MEMFETFRARICDDFLSGMCEKSLVFEFEGAQLYEVCRPCSNSIRIRVRKRAEVLKGKWDEESDAT